MRKVKTVFITVLALLLSYTASGATTCLTGSLPEKVQQTLSTTYANWKVVTPALLSVPDRHTWLENYKRECPGLIRGKFIDQKEGYVANLLQRRGTKTLQQIIYFRPKEDGFEVITISPSSAVDVVTVLRKFSPGKYRSAETGNSVSIKTDTIGISEIDAGTVVYYWDGTRFHTITTSE